MRSNFRFALVLFFCFAISFQILSQTNNYPVIQNNGKKYYVYVVQQSEGLYSISKKFNVTQDEITAANPEIKDGLKNGQEIRIPVKNSTNGNNTATSTTTTTTVQPSTTGYHTVAAGETLYSISRMYNISVDDILKLNPDIENGVVKTGKTIKVSQQQKTQDAKASSTTSSSLGSSTSTSDSYIYHTIEDGETLYSVSKKYDLSIDDVQATNPGLTTSSFSTGKVIRLDSLKIVTNRKIKAEKELLSANRTFEYIAEKKEKIEDVADKFNVTIADLKKVNSKLPNKLSKGDKILIPSLKPVIADTPVQTITPVTPVNSSNTVAQIAVLLPFMVNEKEKKQERDRMVEYYEGFLMALNDAKSAGFSADVYVYDTKASDAEVKNILSKSEMKKMNLIIGPAFDEQVKILSDFSLANNIPLVIPFTSKNDSYQSNPNIYQVNIPQNYLYTEVCNAFVKEFRNYNVILLNATGISNDKADFTDALTSALKQAGISYKNVTMTTTNADAVDAALSSNKSNIIVPSFSTSTSLEKVLPQIKKLKEKKSSEIIRLFGYPEWQTYSKVVRLNYLHPIDTYIYSTFYASLSSSATSTFREDFAKTYSKDIKPTFPKFGLLGYDTGKYFLGAIQKYGYNFQNSISSFYQPGLQMDFHFERVNYWSGFINKSVYFIHFDNNASVDATIFR